MDAAFLLQAGQGASSLATPAWLDVFAVGFGSFTIGVVLTERRTTLVGTLFAGILVEIGGGVIRDFLLGLHPIATETHWYVSTGAVCALAGVVFAHYIPVDAWFVLLLNTCFMALFCVIGANKALVYQSPWPVAIMLGVVAGTGGGILLDLVQGEPPIIFGRDSECCARRSHWHHPVRRPRLVPAWPSGRLDRRDRGRGSPHGWRSVEVARSDRLCGHVA